MADNQELIKALLAGVKPPEQPQGPPSAPLGFWNNYVRPWGSASMAQQKPNWFGTNVLGTLDKVSEAMPPGSFDLAAGILSPGARVKLPMDAASRMGRARAMGFNTDETFYHGTALPKPIEEFRAGQFSDSAHTPHETPAIFFTNDPGLAGQYAYDTGITRRDAIAGRAAQAGVDPERMGRLYPEHPGATNAAVREFQGKAIDALGEYGRVLGPSVRNGTKLDYAALAKELGQGRADAVRHYQELAATAGGYYPDRSAIYPVHVHSNLMDVHSGMFGGQFNAMMYDQLLKRAKDEGYAGLRLRGVVDSPTGLGNPADVVGVFDPKHVRSKFADFDPGQISSRNLMAGMTGAAAVPTLAQYLQNYDSQ